MTRRTSFVILTGLGLLVAVGLARAADIPSRDRPALRLSASPRLGVAPLRVLFKAQLIGGADDDEEFYCASVEWEWDDDSVSEWSRDCDPYRAGASRIERQFSAQHEFKYPGIYRTTLRLKRGSKVLAVIATPIEVVGNGP